MIANMKKEFVVVIEKGLDGYWIADVPELPGCHTQAKTKPELLKRVKEIIPVLLELNQQKRVAAPLVEIQRVVVNA